MPAIPHAPDLRHAVEIAPRVYWVGSHLEHDHFQCHVYLLEHGDESVLFDPGGLLTFDTVRRKVEEVVPFDAIRWFVCHHQDPDIAASIPLLDREVRRPDAAIVTHWRAYALLKHYAPRMPFWLVDEHDWELDLGGRKLRFVFTPYLHFPGAFTTFDELTGTLFSSDLFGGFTNDDELVATDMSYFEDIRPFHEHYMPSREILAHGMEDLETLPLELIAPQHGKIIPKPLIAPVIDRLKRLDCGLYLMVHHDTDIRRLSSMNELLRRAMHRMAVSRDFREVAAALMESASVALPIRALDFFALTASSEVLEFRRENRFRGVPTALPEAWEPLLHEPRPASGEVRWRAAPGSEPAVGIALYSPTSTEPTGVAVLHLEQPVEMHETTLAALSQLDTPLEVALEREMLLRSVELERQRFYEMAMHDPLTGLLNRAALLAMVRRLWAMADRGDVADVVVTMLDIDHFKRVNDTFGHAAGDEVLRAVATVLEKGARTGDLVARIGGEEFVLIHVSPAGTPDELAERLRAGVAALRFSGEPASLRLTLSAGVAIRSPGESFEHALGRADGACYAAKESGRDRTVVADPLDADAGSPASSVRA